MGFFSANCKSCGHPALSPLVTNKINAWMSQVVSIMPGGELHAGEYDGYGRVGTAEYAVGFDAAVWHRACWEAAGKPMEYTGPSKPSPDQGYFYADPEHDMPEPKVGV